MNYKENENWDMCWSHLSRGGCRNSQCKWRHGKYGNSSGRPYQSNGELSRGLSREMSIAPFYPMRQHREGGVEDEHGLVHYAEDTGYNYALQNNPSLSNCADISGSEHSRYSLSTMNASSSGKNYVYTPNSTTMITLDGDRISNSDQVKYAILKAPGDRGKTRESEISAFSQAACQEYLLSLDQVKVKNYHREANASMSVVNTVGKKRMAQKEKISAFSEAALREFLAPVSRFKVGGYPRNQMQVPFLYM